MPASPYPVVVWWLISALITADGLSVLSLLPKHAYQLNNYGVVAGDAAPCNNENCSGIPTTTTNSSSVKVQRFEPIAQVAYENWTISTNQLDLKTCHTTVATHSVPPLATANYRPVEWFRRDRGTQIPWLNEKGGENQQHATNGSYTELAGSRSAWGLGSLNLSSLTEHHRRAYSILDQYDELEHRTDSTIFIKPTNAADMVNQEIICVAWQAELNGYAVKVWQMQLRATYNAQRTIPKPAVTVGPTNRLAEEDVNNLSTPDWWANIPSHIPRKKRITTSTAMPSTSDESLDMSPPALREAGYWSNIPAEIPRKKPIRAAAVVNATSMP